MGDLSRRQQLVDIKSVRTGVLYFMQYYYNGKPRLSEPLPLRFNDCVERAMALSNHSVNHL